jgi:formate dehydrogenase major subunit
MTQRTLNTKLFSTDFLYISESDAEALELTDDEKIRLISRYGEAILPIRISDRVSHGELFATFHDTRVFLNRVTSPHRDRFVQSPEFKVTAVRIEKLS